MIDKDKIGILADLVVSRARVDRTEPDPGNVRAGWHTDWLLTAIDAFVVGQEKDPAAYAEIGRKVFAQVSDLPDIAAFAKLAVIRGERLLSANIEQPAGLLQIMQNLRADIDSLPDGTKKLRCKSLFEYHVGVFYDACGRYDLAADAQRKAWEEAMLLGDQPGAAICRFAETTYRLKSALCIGKDDGSANIHFLCLVNQSLSDVRGTMLEVQWVEGNRPVQLIEACVWLDIHNHPEWDQWVSTALAAADKLGKAWAPGAELIRAVDLAYHDDPQAEAALKAIAEGNDVNERRATALLVLVRRAMAANKYFEASMYVNLMPAAGAQHVRAIGLRLLVR